MGRKSKIESACSRGYTVKLDTATLARVFKIRDVMEKRLKMPVEVRFVVNTIILNADVSNMFSIPLSPEDLAPKQKQIDPISQFIEDVPRSP